MVRDSLPLPPFKSPTSRVIVRGYATQDALILPSHAPRIRDISSRWSCADCWWADKTRLRGNRTGTIRLEQPTFSSANPNFPRENGLLFSASRFAAISKKDKRRAGRKISVSRDFVAWVSRENDKLEDNDARGIINQAADWKASKTFTRSISRTMRVVERVACAAVRERRGVEITFIGSRNNWTAFDYARALRRKVCPGGTSLLNASDRTLFIINSPLPGCAITP